MIADNKPVALQAGTCYTLNGRVLFVAQGIGEETWATYFRTKNGSLAREKSPKLKLQKTREKAQQDLDRFAQAKALRAADRSVTQAPGVILGTSPKAARRAPIEKPKTSPGTALVVAAGDAVVVPVTPADRRELKQAEAVIEKNKAAYLAIGQALQTIRDRQLYRENYATWETYLRDRWSFGRAEAADKIAAARVAAIVSPISNKAQVPLREDHLKALAPLLEDPRDIKAIYQKVLKRTQAEHVPLTGKLLREERIRFETPMDELEARKHADKERRAVQAKASSSRPAAVATEAGGLDSKQRKRWQATLAELAEHVQHIRDNWRSVVCRDELAGALQSLAAEVEGQA